MKKINNRKRRIRNVQDMIILHHITLNNKTYGQVYYDIEEERIYFKSINGKVRCLTDKNPKKIPNTINYKNLWTEEKVYEVNDVVKDASDYNNLYICVKGGKSDIYPKNNDSWDFFLGNQFIFRGLWDHEQEYSLNHCVIDKTDRSLYIAKNRIKSNVPPSGDDNWDIFFCSYWIKPTTSFVDTPIQSAPNTLIQSTPTVQPDVLRPDVIRPDVLPSNFMGIFTNGHCCCHYDALTGLSVFSPCENHKSPEESNMYNNFTIKVNKIITALPLSLIAQNNTKYYDYDIDNGMVYVKEPGFYKITYNITYHGSIYDVKSKVSIIRNKPEPIMYSNNSHVNRQLTDQIIDKYYLENEQLRHINHTFFLPIKDGNAGLMLNIKLNEYNTGKIIFIHPIQTWMVIEKLS